MNIMAKKSKASRIKAERERLDSLYAAMDPNRKALAEGLLENAAFMRIELQDLAKELQEKGWTELFSQGKQEPYLRARPQGQMYNSTNGNYQKIIKQLDAMLPRQEQTAPGDPDDGFDDFVLGRDER